MGGPFCLWRVGVGDARNPSNLLPVVTFPARTDARLDSQVDYRRKWLFGAGWGLVGLVPGSGGWRRWVLAAWAALIFPDRHAGSMMIAPKARADTRQHRGRWINQSLVFVTITPRFYASPQIDTVAYMGAIKEAGITLNFVQNRPNAEVSPSHQMRPFSPAEAAGLPFRVFRRLTHQNDDPRRHCHNPNRRGGRRKVRSGPMLRLWHGSTIAWAFWGQAGQKTVTRDRSRPCGGYDLSHNARRASAP